MISLVSKDQNGTKISI